MATALGNLLVREGRFPAERLEEAFQRQILYGGQLDTNLLEMGLIDEQILLQYMARRFEMPAAGRAEIDTVKPKLLRLFPRRLAERYHVVPLWVDRRHLHIAVSRPLEADVADDIGFMLSLYLVPHITTELRIQFALEQLYTIPMEARFTNLLAQLGEELGPEERTEAVSSWVVDEPARSVGGEAEMSATTPDQTQRDAADEWQVVAAAETGIEVDQISFDAPAESVSDLLTGGVADAATSPESYSADSPVTRLLERLHAEEAALDMRLQQRRERVRWGVEDAAAELALARDRDDIVDVLLRFAYQKLERVAFFTLLGDAFVGWDGIGPDIEEQIRTVRVPADETSALGEVRESRVQRVGALPADDPLRAFLGERTPESSLLWPLFVRNRLLGVLYGDRGEKSIPAATLSRLQLLAPTVSQVFENLILQRKRAQLGVDQEAAAPPPQAEAAPEAPTILGTEATTTTPLTEEPDASGDPEPIEFRAVQPPPLAPQAETSAPQADTSAPQTDSSAPQADTSAPQTDSSAPQADTSAPQVTASSAVTRAAPATAAKTPPASWEPATLSPGTGDEVVGEDLFFLPEELEEALRSQERALDLLMRVGKAAVSPQVRALIGRAESFEENDAQRHQAVEQIARLGPAALPALARSYPGRLRANPFASFEKRPTAAQLSAVCQTLVRMGPESASPVVVGALCSSDALHRLTGLMLLAELEIPAAFDAACDCLLDQEPRIAEYAAQYCTQGGRRPLPLEVSKRIDAYLTSADPARVHIAIATTRACRDRISIPKLIDIIDLAPKDLADAALDALREISKQDFGSNAKKWRTWFKNHGDDRRVQWMIAGLGHKQRVVRQSAQEELNLLSGEFHGYYFDSSRGKRDAAIKRWKEWWELSRKRQDLP